MKGSGQRYLCRHNPVALQPEVSVSLGKVEVGSVRVQFMSLLAFYYNFLNGYTAVTANTSSILTRAHLEVTRPQNAIKSHD